MARFMSRFEYRPGMHRPKTMRNGALFLAATFVVIGIMFLGGAIPFLPKGGTTIKAEFETAANVSTKTPVRVKGIDVGKVEKVERQPDGRGVIVTMRIEDGKGVDLRKDARADILWRTLLGFAFYIQLEPGASEEKLGNATIPMERTTAQVELDQVLAGIDQPSREGMQAIFDEFDTGFGDDTKAGAVVDRLGPAMRNVGPGLDGFRGTESGDLTDLVRDGSRLMGALARNENELGTVVKHANTTLAVTAAQRAALGTMFREGPAALDATRATMARVRTTLDVLDPVAEKLRPGVRELDDASVALRPALRQLDPLLDRAEPLLDDLEPAMRRLGAASAQGTTLIDRLDPTVERVNSTIIPGLDKKNPETDLKVFQAIGPTFSTVSSSASMFDGNGFVQRFTAVTPGEAMVSDAPCSTDLINGTPGIDCSDLQYAMSTVLGLNPPSGSRSSKMLSSAPRSRGDGRTSAGSGPQKRAGSVIKQLADAVGGVL